MKAKILVISFLVFGFYTMQSQIPVDNLVGYWPFSGNANDESGNNHHGTVYGAALTEDRFGNPNSAYLFDGVNDYIAIAPSSLVDNETAITVSCWLKREADDGYGLPVHTGNQGRFGVHVKTDSVKVNVTTDSNYDGSAPSEFDTPFVNFDQTLWNHIVLRYDGTNIRLYINGQLKSEEFAEGKIWTAQSSYLAFGVYMLFGNPNHAYYKGVLDDVIIYNTALSEDEIMDIAQYDICTDTIVNETVTYHVSSLEFEGISPVTVMDSVQNLVQSNGICDSIVHHYSEFVFDPVYCTDTIHELVYDTLRQEYLDGIVAYYPFNGNAEDESGNNYHGTVYDATLSEDRYGNPASAYYFDGDNDFLDFGNGPLLNAAFDSDISFSVWFKTNSQVEQRIFSKRTSYRGIEIITFEKNRLGVFYGGDNYKWWIYPKPTFLPDQWNHVVVNIDRTGGLVHSYLNGIKIDSTVSINTITGNISNSQSARIGANKDVHGDFTGSIDELRVYNRLLKESEILQLYNREFFYDTITNEVFDTTFVVINDTITTEVFDTTYVTHVDSVSVTDTLIIEAVLTDLGPPENTNTLKVYPNPAKDYLYINTGEFELMNGYRLKIINQLGETVFDTNIEEPLYELNLSDWTGYGMYFLQVIDTEGDITEVRKIILQ